MALTAADVWSLADIRRMLDTVPAGTQPPRGGEGEPYKPILNDLGYKVSAAYDALTRYGVNFFSELPRAVQDRYLAIINQPQSYSGNVFRDFFSSPAVWLAAGGVAGVAGAGSAASGAAGLAEESSALGIASTGGAAGSAAVAPMIYEWGGYESLPSVPAAGGAGGLADFALDLAKKAVTQRVLAHYAPRVADAPASVPAAPVGSSSAPSYAGQQMPLFSPEAQRQVLLFGGLAFAGLLVLMVVKK